MSDDDFQAAADGGMEPELSIEQLRAGDTRDSDGDDDADDSVDLRGGSNTEIVRRGRVVSDRTRELFKSAAAAIKKQLSAGDDDEDVNAGDIEETATPAPNAAAVATKEPQADTKATETPPAPSLDPRVMERLQKLDARQAEIEAREAKLVQLERASDLATARDAYYERGAVAIRDLVKQWHPNASEDELREEIGDLITDLTHNVLGVDVPTEVKNALRSKRALKSVEAYKQRLSATDAERAKREEAEKQQASERQAIASLDKELTNPERPHIKALPFLTSEDNPGEIVLDVMREHQKRTGEMMQWEEAAKQANNYLEKQWRRGFDKRRHLFTAAPEGAAPAKQTERPQGDPSGIRRSQTLSNATAAAAAPTTQTTPPPVDKNGKWSREAHRANIKRKYREAFTRSDD